MKESHFRPLLLIILVCLYFSTVIKASDVEPGWAGLKDYPRIEHFEQGSVQVDFPTLESWPDFRILKAWLPVEIKLNEDSTPQVGSVYVQAKTDIDFNQRTVKISEARLLKIKFPGEDESGDLGRLVTRAFHERERTVPLDVLLRLLPEDFKIPGQSSEAPKLNLEPPVILVSESPLQLLSIDKEPVRAPIVGTGLEYVVNTSWNVFYHARTGRWYVLNDGAWQQSNYLSDGGWDTVDKLPSDFGALQNNDNWPNVQAALPPRIPSEPPVPFVISLQATELILLDGEPRLADIRDTGIRYVSNTKSDLFELANRWYLLVSGRWFSSNDLGAQWQSVKSLPDAFAQIPAKHVKAHVLFSVPGTRQAKLAMIEAALPHRVSIAKNPANPLEVSWVGEPKFEAIETTQLQRGLNTPFQVIKHNNHYYLCYEGAWYFSASAEGPWNPALNIPDEIYRIPSTDPAYNVTFVRLDSEQDEKGDHVNYSYSGGYTGSFSTTVSVVYGTGWHHPSSVFWDPWNKPYYWHFRWAYGHNIGYHPVGAYYGSRSTYHDPWLGWYGSKTVTLNSPTVDFTHGYGSSWDGPLQTRPGDPSEAAEKSLDAFLPRKKVDGTETFTDTSKDTLEKTARVSASSLYAGSVLSSSLVSGPDGEVYKHEDDEWSQYNEDGWTTMRAIEQDQRYAQPQPSVSEPEKNAQWLPAHKRTLSRSELDRQELARLEGMENYSRYRMEKESGN